MDLNTKVNHKLVYRKERIPGLSIDITKKRFVFSRKYHGRNIKIRFTFSKIKNGNDYVMILNECKSEAERFQRETDEQDELAKKQKENKLKDSKKKREFYSRINGINTDESDKFFERMTRRDNKIKFFNFNRRTVRQEKKRLKFKNSITNLMKTKLIEDIKASRTDFEDVLKINAIQVKFEKFTPKIFYEMKEILEYDNRNEVKNESTLGLGTKSVIVYINNRKYNGFK